jgi:hypothetical protein
VPFIIALAWPARRKLELALRLLLCVTLMVALIFMEAPLTIVAELWSLIRALVAPDQFSGWLLSSRFLMGGGGLLISGLCGVLAVAAAHRVTVAEALPSAELLSDCRDECDRLLLAPWPTPGIVTLARDIDMNDRQAPHQ